MNSVMSFDVSSVSTGWSYFKNNRLTAFGIIAPKDTKASLCEKLGEFGSAAALLLGKYEPKQVVIEETYLKNVKTLKKLNQYVTIVQCACCEILGVEPAFVGPTSVRKHFKIKDKRAAYKYVVKKYKTKFKKSTFKKDNDISDSILQGLYFIEKEKMDE